MNRIALVFLGLGVVSVIADPNPKPRPRPQDPLYDDGYNYNYDDGDYGDYGYDENANDYGDNNGYGEPDAYDDINRQPAVPDAPSAVEVDYNFDEVTDKCDKEECPPTNCASPYIPLGECCPVCPPQETIQPSYEERRGSTQGSGRPGAPGAEGRPGSAGRPGAPGPPGPQPDIAPLLGQINSKEEKKVPHQTLFPTCRHRSDLLDREDLQVCEVHPALKDLWDHRETMGTQDHPVLRDHRAYGVFLV